MMPKKMVSSLSYITILTKNLTISSDPTKSCRTKGKPFVWFKNYLFLWMTKNIYFISIEQDLFSGFPLYFFRPPFNINIIDTNFENHHFRIYDNYNNYSIIRSSHLSYITVIMIRFAYTFTHF